MVFFVLKSFISGGNRTGGAAHMSVGPDRRPPGKIFLVRLPVVLYSNIQVEVAAVAVGFQTSFQAASVV